MRKYLVLFLLFMFWLIYHVAKIQPEIEVHQSTEPAHHVSDLDKWREANRTTKAGAICNKHDDWQPKECETVAAHKVGLGMNAEQVRLSWGKPSAINETVTTGLTFEQWVYSKSGQYVYLENGVVTSMQTGR
jgi:hypothetical protein